MRSFLRAGGVSTLTIMCGVSAAEAAGNTERQPNVILILADDMGVGDIAANNGGLNRTPNLDQLLDQSVWFEQGYSASAVSAPARAGLLTGRYPTRTGVIGLDMNNHPDMTSLGRDEKTLGNVFSDNGYRTALIGKWHLGNRPEHHPLRRGFDECAKFLGGEDLQKSYFTYRLDFNGGYENIDGPYLTDKLTDLAISFVDRHQDTPFFLHLAYYAPHRPLSAPRKLIEYYVDQGFDRKTAQIYAMIEVMDHGIGRLMQELDRLGIRDNTIVIFASDNGPDPVVGERFNTNLRGTKYTVYEGGIRVPIMFNWRGRLPAYRYHEPFHFVDIFPTLVSFCGVDIPSRISGRLDGTSAASDLLTGKQKSTSTVRYWHWNRGEPYYSHNAAVRDGDWKLVRPFVSRDMLKSESDLSPVLYNLRNDPGEQHDVSADHPKIYKKLHAELTKWSRSVEADRQKSVLSNR